MPERNQEMEAKFYLLHPDALILRLESLGAKLKHSRVFETNLRFDTPDGKLVQAQQVLRLRKDERFRLTFKGPTQPLQPVATRVEIELEVMDFANARALLEALGYRVIITYEKWRTTYQLGEVEVVLDELPYGNFCELEGPDAAVIERAAQSLSLNWERRTSLSYLALFDQYRFKQHKSLKNLIFSEFTGIHPSPDELGILPAD